MKILVTGAAGFIGSHFSENLASLGYHVTGVDNLSDYYSKKLKLSNVASIKKAGIDFFENDLREAGTYKKLAKDFDYIFHFAAQPGLSSTATFEDYLSNNVTATNELLKYAMLNNHLKLFVNISTSSVYGLDATKDETEVPAPVSDYGITKLAAEQMALAKSRNNFLNACSLRLYSVYGPRERPDKLYTKLIISALNDEPFTLLQGSLEHKRSFTYVSDITEGIAKVIDKETLLKDQIINIGSNVQHTTAYGIETVESLKGKKIKFEMLSARTGDQTSTQAVINKAKRLLNYEPSISLQQGISEQIKWMEENRAIFADI